MNLASCTHPDWLNEGGKPQVVVPVSCSMWPCNTIWQGHQISAEILPSCFTGFCGLHFTDDTHYWRRVTEWLVTAARPLVDASCSRVKGCPTRGNGYSIGAGKLFIIINNLRVVPRRVSHNSPPFPAIPWLPSVPLQARCKVHRIYLHIYILNA